MTKDVTPLRPSSPASLKLVSSAPSTSFMHADDTAAIRSGATEKIRNSGEESKRREHPDDFLYRFLIRDSLQKTADTFGISPGMVDAFRRRRMSLKAHQLLEAMEKDRSIVIEILQYLGVPYPLPPEELKAFIQFRDTIRAMARAEAIAADADRFLTGQQGKEPTACSGDAAVEANTAANIHGDAP